MKRIIYLILLLLTCGIRPALSQTMHPDTIASRLWRQVAAFPQEKLYVQTDRAEYVAGDTIWMRHHVVDALTNLPSLASRYVYVELVSPAGDLLRRVMMRQDERGAIYGYMPTTHDMPSGVYMLRAYTRYMADTTPGYLFVRPLRFYGRHKGSVAAMQSAGHGHIDLQLMPEGGHMVIGRRCRVAYKAVGPDGMGLDMAAVVTDDDGTVVALSSATHCGMGMFYTTPQPGHTYRVTCTSVDGRKVVAPLPKSSADMPALTVTQNSSSVIASVLCPDGYAMRQLWLVVHQGGAPVYAQPLKQGTVRFGREMFRDGIVSFMLANDQMDIISERLAFVWNGAGRIGGGTLSVSPSDGTMRSVSVTLPDTACADCAVSVVDAGCAADTACSIVSTLLLSQELRGYIEQPSWYFAGRGRSGQLDLLMLTQGWRRYDVQDALKGRVHNAGAVAESSMHIAGKVTSDVTTTGRKGANVTLSSNRGGYADATTTDSNGRFEFGGFEMPDSTAYILAALSGKGSANNIIRVDSVRYPAMDYILPQVKSAVTDTAFVRRGAMRIAASGAGRTVLLPDVEVESRYREKTEYEKLTKINGVSISEATLAKEGSKNIVDMLKAAGTGLVYDYTSGWFKYRGEESLVFVDGTALNLDTYLSKDANAGTQSTPLSVFLAGICSKDVQQVDIIKGALVGTLPGLGKVGGLSQDNSAIVITTKRTGSAYRSNVEMVRRLGYQRPAAFYNPRYAAPDGYAMRQTVCWNPALRVCGGKAVVSFLPNGARRYRVTVEGVDANGRIVSAKTEF